MRLIRRTLVKSLPKHFFSLRIHFAAPSSRREGEKKGKLVLGSGAQPFYGTTVGHSLNFSFSLFMATLLALTLSLSHCDAIRLARMNGEVSVRKRINPEVVSIVSSMNHARFKSQLTRIIDNF